MKLPTCSSRSLSWPPVLSMTAIVAIGFLLTGCGGASSGGAQVQSTGTSAGDAGPPAATAAGFAGVAFGTAQDAAQAELVNLLGRPTNDVTRSDLPASCGISATAEWKGLSAFYFKGKFAGYEYRGVDVQGPHGLHVGMSIAAAKASAGHDFTTSAAQGGSWLLQTSEGKVSGYLDGMPPKGRIASIDAGSVGCPAMTP